MLRRLTLAAAAVMALGLGASTQAQTGYGVTGNGTLFRFNVQSTVAVTTIGNLGIVPEAIDFRPGTNQLYALDVGPATTRLYTVNVNTAAITPVGDGFPSEVADQPAGNYDLVGATIGFDFNPRTLQGDGSVRIRVVASTGSNLRLNSDTGEIAAVDDPLEFAADDENEGETPQVDSAAYTNSFLSTSAAGGPTTLYHIDFGQNVLTTQDPPNSGVLNTVGPLGVTVDANANIGFDIFSAGTDASNADDFGYAVLTRPGDDSAYNLYDVNLATGQITNGRLVGGGVDFEGGFAVQGTGIFALKISEFRVRGPNGANDEFVELMNTAGEPLTVNAADASAGFAVAASDGVARCTIPNGTIIPARGHYLCVNSVGYSLASYPAGNGTTATGDATYTTDIPDNAGIALFSTATAANFNLGNRLDAVGSTSEANATYKEGTGYPALTPFSIDYAWVRDYCGKSGSITTFGVCPTDGALVDTDNNASNFYFVDTNGTSAGGGQRLGTPGPQNLSSPVQNNASIAHTLLDPCVAPTSPPNRVRDFTSDPANNSTFGTLDIRRTYTNNTGISVGRLRFRVADVTTFPAPSGVADLRPRTSTAVVVTVDRAPCNSGTSNVTVEGTVLEQPPAQPNGGSFNSSMSVGTITLATPLEAGASVDVRFLLGIQQTGSFRIYLDAETSAGVLPGAAAGAGAGESGSTSHGKTRWTVRPSKTSKSPGAGAGAAPAAPEPEPRGVPARGKSVRGRRGDF